MNDERVRPVRMLPLRPLPPPPTTPKAANGIWSSVDIWSSFHLMMDFCQAYSCPTYSIKASLTLLVNLQSVLSIPALSLLFLTLTSL